MDIQRGDQVYYRGELWTVRYVTPADYGEQEGHIEIERPVKASESCWVPLTDLQRVEQVR